MFRPVEELRQRLMRAARSAPPSEAVPPGFEARVLASLRRGASSFDPSRLWLEGLMRAAWGFAGLSLLVTGWMWLAPGPTANGADSEVDLEWALMAALDEGAEDQTW